MQSEPSLFSTLSGDPHLGELVELYVQEMPERIALLERLAAAQHWEELAHAAHQLKGSAGGYGFGILAGPAERLEQAALKGADTSSILQALAHLVQLCRRIGPATL
jgi:HPt (histidine-containing phosphotransfer) domain-containing protein